MTSKENSVHVVFIGKSQFEAGWPYLGFDNEKKINETFNILKEKYPTVNFTKSSMITSQDEKAVKLNQDFIQNSDACIFFTIGHLGDPKLIEYSLDVIRFKKIPMILANFIYMGDHSFLKIYTATKNENLPLIISSSENLEDFKPMIDILINLLEMKGKRVLLYATDDPSVNWDTILKIQEPELERIVDIHPEFVQNIKAMKDEDAQFFTDHEGQDQAHKWRKNEALYGEILQSVFKVKLIRENPEEVITYYDKVSDDEASEIAQKWIEGAQKVIPTRNTILNSAKLYLAFKQLLIDKDCDIFAPDCGTLLLTGRLPAFPCMGFFELVNDQKYGVCESDMDCLITYLFGLSLINRPGFVANHTFDTIRNQVTYLHCVCSNKPFGLDGASCNYDILYHGETAILGASPRVEYPIGETLTSIKISVFEKKIAIRTGKIVDNVIDEKACTTKVVVESNVPKILENYDWETFGWHRVSFVGDWRETFILGAKLLGLDVVEVDK